jgi:hypothetical protein
LNLGAGVAADALPPDGAEGVPPKVPPLVDPPRPAAGGNNVLPVLLEPAPLGVPDTPDDGVLVVGAVEPEPVVEAPELGVPDAVELPPVTTPLLGNLLVVVRGSTTAVGSTGVGVADGVGVGVGVGLGGGVGSQPNGLRHCGGSVGVGVGVGRGVGGGVGGRVGPTHGSTVHPVAFVVILIKVLSKTPPINETLCASCIAPHLPVLMFAQPAATIFS